MRYWFFDGSDVIGPFSPKELTEQKSFGETSLICPENFGEDGDHWQVAGTFAEFKPLFMRLAAEAEGPTLEQEMDTLLKEASPLAFDETPTDKPNIQLPAKPPKPGPIEDYFDRVKEKDLGNILGIPNPADNSDMDLAHALEKQLAKTSSTRREKQQDADQALDEQTALELTQAQETHHVATATEVFATKFEDKLAQQAAEVSVSKPQSMPLVELPQMPTLQQEPALQAVPPEQTLPPLPATEPQEATEAAPQEQPATQNLQPAEPETQTATQTAQIPQETPAQEPGGILPDPAVLRTEKVEVNSVNARLKQTQEMKDFLRHTQHTQHIKQQLISHARMIVALLAVLAVTGGLLLAFALRPKKSPATVSAKAADAQTAQHTTNKMKTQELLAEPAAAKTAEPAPTNSGEQKALAIVYNYPLSNQRGTLGEYLSRIYQGQLSQGYLGSWEAEPLYKNTYIVKYRLTKTRKEPIIYVFQADVAKGKLTGALNNISIDLVGKI